MKKKIALIFGVTGQDGSYLARFLLKKNYIVHGIRRRSSSFNTSRVNDIYLDPNEKNVNFFLHYGDVTDSLSVLKVIQRIVPDEIYNLAAQSHVHVSFETPEYTANTDALGTLRILEAIKTLNLIKKTKFYQAGTSELYGLSGKKFKFQDENTLFHPRSPYAVAKLYAHWICINYREAYKIHCSNGILFNHESPVRGETFVTKKIVKGLVDIKKGLKKTIYLGNLYSKRDWGHAKEYVVAMWKILQRKIPNDYVIATGKSYSIKHFINLTLKYLNIKFIWKGKGINEKCYLKDSNKFIIAIDKKYFRPTEVDNLRGNPRKANSQLKWKAKITLDKLIKEMVDYELNNKKY
jgi:GDPmannose 4,6-dehydratase